MIGKHLGYACLVDPDKGTPEEWDVLTCGHTNRVIFVKPGENVYRCTCCGSYIHPSEVGKGCHPMEKKLEIWESRARLAEAMNG